ncbi:right-handed parallel beta-helix repeat-containing protein [Streptomyces sp. NPDC054833]
MRRRSLLAGIAAGGLGALGAAPAALAHGRCVLHVRPGGSVQAAVDAVDGPGWTIVVHPGTYREVVHVPADKAELTVRGAGRDPRAAVVVYDNANGTQRPADGIAIKFGSGTGNLVTGARLYNNADDGIDFWSFSSPVTVEHTWSFGNGVNRWSDSAFAGDGNGYKLGGDGEVVAHVVNNSAAWGNAGNGFTENSNTGAIAINRTTAYANGKWGYYFATSAARLGKNLAVSNGSGRVTKGSSVVSAGNNWDSGISTPSFVSTDASTTYNSRKSDGSLPSTTFLTTGSTTIGATMN